MLAGSFVTQLILNAINSDFNTAKENFEQLITIDLFYGKALGITSGPAKISAYTKIKTTKFSFET